MVLHVLYIADIFTFSCIAWFIEQLFCAVSDSC